MSDVPDPRPLTGEPLALDLVNTTWIDDAGAHDLLDSPPGVAGWFARWDESRAVPLRTAANLRATRSAIRGFLEHPGDEAAHDALDAVLARGRVRLTLEGGHPGERVEVPDAWRLPWEAARNLLLLLEHRPDRIKPCANPDCVLWFDDATRSGTRRWCSMNGGCGGRLKARRHRTRSQLES